MPYAKIWTDCYSDEWFLSLSLVERSIWLQVIVLAKMQQDSGIFVTTLPRVGNIFGGDGRTVDKVLTKMSQQNKIDYKRNDDGVITIKLRNYLYWQQDRDSKLKTQKRKNMARSCQTGDKNVPSQRNTEKHNTDKILYLDCVLLTERQHQELVDKFGEQGAADRIANLNNYVMSKKKKYDSHYHTILNWERRDQKEKAEKQPLNKANAKAGKYDGIGIK